MILILGYRCLQARETTQSGWASRRGYDYHGRVNQNGIEDTQDRPRDKWRKYVHGVVLINPRIKNG